MERDRFGEPDGQTPTRQRSRLVTLAVALPAQLGILAIGGAMAVGAAGGVAAPLDLASHFQVQYFFGAIACLLVLAAARRWRWVVLAAFVTLIGGAQVVPWYLPGSPGPGAAVDAPPGAPRLRVLLVNVLTTNEDRAAVNDLVREVDPDVLVLQEVDDAWMRALAPTRTRYPHAIASPRGDNFGIALLSRHPFDRESIAYFGPSGVPSVVATVEIDDARITIVSTHPVPPLAARRAEERNAQLAEVAQFIDGLRGPVLLVGDLNVTMWSAPYRRLVGQTRLRDARRGFGILPTWSQRHPWFMRIPIDHCLHTDDLVVERCETGPRVGSDHLPLLVDLALTAAGGR